MINNKPKGRPATKNYTLEVAKRTTKGKILLVRWVPKEVKNV